MATTTAATTTTTITITTTTTTTTFTLHKTHNKEIICSNEYNYNTILKKKTIQHQTHNEEERKRGNKI